MPTVTIPGSITRAAKKMALFTTEEARAAYRGQHPNDYATRSAGVELFREQLDSLYRTGQEHDVFVSYSHRDSEVVLGICYILRRTFGLNVYVDRDDVTLSTEDEKVANQLRQRMKSCLSLVYIASNNDSQSHWMPWELGYFDGLRGTVAVLPITETASTEKPQDRPYLRLYPYIDKTSLTLWVNDRRGHFENFREWVRKGGKFDTATASR
jgi:hypothetical protein